MPTELDIPFLGLLLDEDALREEFEAIIGAGWSCEQDQPIQDQVAPSEYGTEELEPDTGGSMPRPEPHPLAADPPPGDLAHLAGQERGPPGRDGSPHPS